MPLAALALVLAAATSTPPASGADARTRAGAPEVPAALAFERLYSAGPAGVRIAPEVEALAGRTVRIVGHMVRMEEPSRSAFYLAARPAAADESGGGTGDVPPGAIRVELPALAGDVPWLAGPVEVVGRLEVGRAEDAQGRVSFLRIVVDLPPAPPAGDPKHPPRAPGGPSPSSKHEGGHP